MGYGRDERRCPSNKAINFRIIIRGVVIIEPWRAFRVILLFDSRVDDTTDHCHQCEQSKIDDDLWINLTLNPATFARSATGVEDDLGVHTGEEHDTDSPSCIPENGTTQHDHLDIGRGLFSVASNGGVELVQVDVGTVAFDRECVECVGAVLGSAKIRKKWDGIAGLEVSLAIEILGFEKSDVLVLGGRAYKHIRGDRFILRDFYKVAYADILPESILPVNVDVFLLMKRIGRVRMVELDGGVRRRLGVILGMGTFRNNPPDKGTTLGT